MPLSRTAAAALLLLLPIAALGQNENEFGEVAVASACAGVAIIVPFSILVINVLILVWVARDAKARGMDNPIIWMLLVFFTSFIGLIIYVFARPQGEKAPCANCNNGRLKSLTKCPHCGAS